jgi:hypothetical protein
MGQFELRRKEKARLIQTFKQALKIGVLRRFGRLIIRGRELDAEIGSLALFRFDSV